MTTLNKTVYKHNIKYNHGGNINTEYGFTTVFPAFVESLTVNLYSINTVSKSSFYLFVCVLYN